MVKVGQIYRHYKGHIYKVLCLGKNSETLETEVVYENYEISGEIWVRPLVMFEEKLSDGRDRFQLIREE